MAKKILNTKREEQSCYRSVRLSKKVYDLMEERATREGKSFNQLLNEILEKYLLNGDLEFTTIIARLQECKEAEHDIYTLLNMLYFSEWKIAEELCFRMPVPYKKDNVTVRTVAKHDVKDLQNDVANEFKLYQKDMIQDFWEIMNRKGARGPKQDKEE